MTRRSLLLLLGGGLAPRSWAAPTLEETVLRAKPGLLVHSPRPLDAETPPELLDSWITPRARFFGSDSLRVGLERDLLPVASELRAHLFEHPRHILGRKQARRSAAEINSIHGELAQLLHFADFAADRGGIRRIKALGKNARVEIAVRALRLAERHLNVDSEVHDASGSGTILSITSRRLGPSNSQKNIACQRPSARRPPAINTVAELPVSAVLMCESELPSPCR